MLGRAAPDQRLGRRVEDLARDHGPAATQIDTPSAAVGRHPDRSGREPEEAVLAGARVQRHRTLDRPVMASGTHRDEHRHVCPLGGAGSAPQKLLARQSLSFRPDRQPDSAAAQYAAE